MKRIDGADLVIERVPSFQSKWAFQLSLFGSFAGLNAQQKKGFYYENTYSMSNAPVEEILTLDS